MSAILANLRPIRELVIIGVGMLIIGVQFASWLGWRQQSPSQAMAAFARELQRSDSVQKAEWRRRDSVQAIRDAAAEERERKREIQEQRNAYQFCVLFRRPQSACEEIMGIRR